jgi:hypothetical protein
MAGCADMYAHSREQSVILRELGRSLADVAAFMHEVELEQGFSVQRPDQRGIDRLRTLALRMQVRFVRIGWYLFVSLLDRRRLRGRRRGQRSRAAEIQTLAPELRFVLVRLDVYEVSSGRRTSLYSCMYCLGSFFP